MISPVSTYRLQFSGEFNFEDFQEMLNYLEDLGISTIYSAPFFKAREGSTHGYDVVDPFRINPEIGRLKTFKLISERLKEKKMSWLQDIVPNHMAYDADNPWLCDIFELGPNSSYYHFFDIDWNYKGWNKVMAPFLGDSLEEVIKNGELLLKLDEQGIKLTYYDHSYPIAARSYSEILSGIDSGFVEKFQEFSGNKEQWEDLKLSFLREVREDAELKEKIAVALKDINTSEDNFRQILELQYFKPTHWKETENEINYRRFFTINGLICLRMEDPQVFEIYHHFIKELCEEGMIDGLRIDHIDGLFDPSGYTESLRNLMGNDLYVVVEKILEWEEKLPEGWPVQGTSGYDFLAVVNQLFTKANKEADFAEHYKELFPGIPDYEKLVYEKKLFILKERMGGELQNLWRLLKDSNLLLGGEDQNREKWTGALGAFLAAFPVYRIYPQKFPLSELEQELIETAYQKAYRQFSGGEEELDYLKSLYLGKAGKDKEKMLFFLQRSQQYSGPLAAKGVEDTSFYIFNRLIAHNEVGDSPDNFGISIEDFHQKMLEKQQVFPLSVNATATHDTKRGEDARMRLNVLSEMPTKWFSLVDKWKKISAKIRKNDKAPDPNEEYFIYQAILGAMPFGDFDMSEFLQRTVDYLQKVMREAKVNSNWSTPNTAHEEAVFEFIEGLLEDSEFRASFDPFAREISCLGAVKSLGQNLIKLTAPGIPDVYQGTELWDLSYVDPDNRRPVDYDLRKKFLHDFYSAKDDNIKSDLRDLRKDFGNGKIKMYCLHKVLSERRSYPEVFTKGEYIPLEISGELSGKIIAYARRKENKWFIVVAPVLVAELFTKEDLLPELRLLDESYLLFPEKAPEEWKNFFTHQSLNSAGKIALKELLSDFPIAFITNIA